MSIGSFTGPDPPMQAKKKAPKNLKTAPLYPIGKIYYATSIKIELFKQVENTEQASNVSLVFIKYTPSYQIFTNKIRTKQQLYVQSVRTLSQFEQLGMYTFFATCKDFAEVGPTL